MHPSPVGNFTQEPFANQTKIINDYFEKIDKPGTICVHQFFGRDEAHVFLEIFCGNFKINNKNAVEMVNGYRHYSSAAYNSNFQITTHESPAEGSFYQPSLIRMYPEVAFKKIPFGVQGDPQYPVYESEIRARLENNLAP